MKKYDLQERLTNFSIDVLKITDQMSSSDYTSKYLSQQLIRSGISPALNYAEAQGSESKADFKHKLSIVLKELRESQVTLKILSSRSEILKPEMNSIQLECAELVAIFTSSVIEIKRDLKQGK